MIREVYSARNGSIFIDAIGLQEIPTLIREFRNYEKFFVHMIELEFVPNQPVTVGGTISMAPDYDPIDPFPASSSAMSQSEGFVSKPVTSACRVKMPNFRLPDGGWMRPSLFTGPNNNDRLVAYGHINYMTTSSLADDIDLGRLIVHWDISFSVLQPPTLDTILSYPGTQWAITSVCDNVGTVSAIDFLSSVQEDELLLYNAAHSSLVVMNPGSVFSAIISGISGAGCSSRGGKAVLEGTRVFFRPPRTTVTSATGLHKPMSVTTSEVGAFSLSRTFDSLMDILINRTVAAWIDLANIKQIN